MSENSPSHVVEERSYHQFDYKEDPDAWVSSYCDALRDIFQGDTFVREVGGNGENIMGDYEQPFIWESTGESLAAPALIQRYTEELLDLGIKTVNIVDFGAGSATTLCKAAVQMENLIKDGRVNMIATNLVTTPTLDDLETLISGARTPREYDRYQTLKKAVTENLVQFKAAHISELEEDLKGEPIHLMFMVNVFPSTIEFNDYLLKKASEMLDSEYGTLVAGRRGLSSELFFREDEKPWDLMRRGADSLVTASFRQKPEDLFGEKGKLTFTTFQAPKAPAFIPDKAV